jgi:hypothetical protein
MARRRTRAEKIAAKLRKQLERVEPVTTTQVVAPKEDYYVPEVALSTKLLTSDLTKSLAVTILALLVQFSLAVYLNRGGWQQVNTMLQKIATSF